MDQLPIKDTEMHPRFTVSERQIIVFLAEGMRVKEIAQQLDYSLNTINVYLSSRIYPKLGVNNRYSAVIEAERVGLLHVPELSLDEAIELSIRVGKISLSDRQTSEEKAQVEQYNALVPVMAKKMKSPDKREAFVGISFTARHLQGQFYGLSKQAHSMYPVARDWVWDESTNKPTPGLESLPQVYSGLALACSAMANRLGEMSQDSAMEHKYPQSRL